MSLNMLPAHVIEDEYNRITAPYRDGQHPKIDKLMKYFEDTWIKPNKSWTIKNWSVFGMRIRTNNDLEGWHNKFQVCFTHYLKNIVFLRIFRSRQNGKNTDSSSRKNSYLKNCVVSNICIRSKVKSVSLCGMK